MSINFLLWLLKHICIHVYYICIHIYVIYMVYFMRIAVLPTWMSVWGCQITWNWVIDSCELPCGCWEQNNSQLLLSFQLYPSCFGVFLTLFKTYLWYLLHCRKLAGCVRRCTHGFCTKAFREAPYAASGSLETTNMLRSGHWWSQAWARTGLWCRP